MYATADDFYRIPVKTNSRRAHTQAETFKAFGIVENDQKFSYTGERRSRDLVRPDRSQNDLYRSFIIDAVVFSHLANIAAIVRIYIFFSHTQHVVLHAKYLSFTVQTIFIFHHTFCRVRIRYDSLGIIRARYYFRAVHCITYCAFTKFVRLLHNGCAMK